MFPHQTITRTHKGVTCTIATEQLGYLRVRRSRGYTKSESSLVTSSEVIECFLLPSMFSTFESLLCLIRLPRDLNIEFVVCNETLIFITCLTRPSQSGSAIKSTNLRYLLLGIRQYDGILGEILGKVTVDFIVHKIIISNNECAVRGISYKMVQIYRIRNQLRPAVRTKDEEK